MELISKKKAVKIIYTNYKGITSKRNIIPQKIWYGKSAYHSQEQWFLEAYDIDKEDKRDFAIIDIKNWENM